MTIRQFEARTVLLGAAGVEMILTIDGASENSSVDMKSAMNLATQCSQIDPQGISATPVMVRNTAYYLT